jgi:aspartyl-tRNA(Asn)/glutamyl-tRNA(Gln) amidotransferase subunit A
LKKRNQTTDNFDATVQFFRSISDIQRALRESRLTLVQLTEYYLQRIRQFAHLNAFIEVYEKEALQRAEALDHKPVSQRGKLFGAVMGIKDNINHKGHHASASSKILQGYTALYNATVIERLLAEDAIIIGRLNCDEFAMGSSNENSCYGPVLNYLDHQKVPGGSSGGSAVAVQADLCHATLGTDTGGSIRQPASFCGIVGLKPTYGRVSRWGLIAYASSFDQIGPMTKCVEDAALILEVIAGKDEYDSTVSQTAVPPYSKLLKLDYKPGVAYLKQTIEHKGLDPFIRKFIQNLLSDLSQKGHEVSDCDFPYLDYIVPTYYVLTTAEASSNLARYDGVRFGYRAPDAADMEQVYTKTRTQGFGKEVKRRIMLGTFVLSAGYYDAYYSKAQKVRRLIRDSTFKILEKSDFLITPTTPSTAFGIGEKTKDPIAMYLEDIYTVQANLTGLPAISIPLGTHENGMPFGIQIMSTKFSEQKLLAFAQYLMEEYNISTKAKLN